MMIMLMIVCKQVSFLPSSLLVVSRLVSSRQDQVRFCNGLELIVQNHNIYILIYVYVYIVQVSLVATCSYQLPAEATYTEALVTN